MGLIIFRNAAVLDGAIPGLREGCDVVVEDDTIRDVSDRPVFLRDGAVIDVKGRTLMPGLIDCHVHATATMLDLAANAALPATLIALRALPILKGMLMRGFTTVRDAGGADHALALAVETGLVPGPRMFIAGRALSQTGGHGDFRGRFDESEPCACGRRGGVLARIADGVDAVRKAVREEIKAGASQIKVMASGGVASPTDPIHFLGYSVDELKAVVEEARNADTYVMAHAYTAAAIMRAVACGVRTIEHANLADAAAARAMAQNGAYAVPTLVTYEALAHHGAALGLPPGSVAKVEGVRAAGLESLSVFKAAGVKMAFGTDLLGELHMHQGGEFGLRARVLSPPEVIASATTVAAEVLRMDGRLGVIAPGALADILVVDGNPLQRIDVLEGQGERLDVIMKAGVFVKNRFGPVDPLYA